ncbi:hypothetical protein BAUCODRAFT_335433 [Baudoinia panamericana UAMH 10762]|uniref:Uncharacterized protein n=1 Tax=Baudoinia panamericana (strain UAMH 10762) TaxID=717646 RepID=M2MWA0_BAUPA|nr:uncharacterized protein BAUCODRAFT_335433 [Baudoinia panamericana UAMH 10762]EMC90859.1 hypothetical protein BAUCODRAFT_335433 [Baudoinia panamericana UAMH 10762]
MSNRCGPDKHRRQYVRATVRHPSRLAYSASHSSSLFRFSCAGHGVDGNIAFATTRARGTSLASAPLHRTSSRHRVLSASLRPSHKQAAQKQRQR